jgi:hypothetical protein
MFLFGPKEESAPHMHHLVFGDTPGVIAMKDPETGYIVTRDYPPHGRYRYHFTVTKGDTVILRAELIPSEDLGPKLVLHIASPQGNENL